MPITLCRPVLLTMTFSILAAGYPAQAAEWERDRDEIGLYKEPVCDYGFRVKSALINIAKQAPTGITATNASWEMEVFNNPESKSWTLVGKSRAAADANSSKLCRLSSGQQSPYEEQPWFKKYFGK